MLPCLCLSPLHQLYVITVLISSEMPLLAAYDRSISFMSLRARHPKLKIAGRVRGHRFQGLPFLILPSRHTLTL